MSELQDLTALIRASTPLIVIETQEEQRIVELFRQSLMQGVAGPVPLDDYRGPAPYRPGPRGRSRRPARCQRRPADDPPGRPARHLPAVGHAPYLGYASHQRLLRDILERRHSQAHVLVMIGTKVELPPELEGLATRFSPHLPDANALLKMLREEAADYARENGGRRVEVDTEVAQQILRNLKGLGLHDARRIARQLIFNDGVLGEHDLPQLAKLKFELLNRSGHLHYEYDNARFADVAGANRLKRWINQRRGVFVSGNAPPGLDPPKGVLLLGVQGCGKSMLAKATAAGFGVPLLRLDFGSLYNKYHGETEKNLRDALASAEQLAPCVLWIDEIEKGLASGGEDGGVSRRVLGHLLTWMAERKGAVFIVATANQVRSCRPNCCARVASTKSSSSTCPAPTPALNCCACASGRRGLDLDSFALPALAAACNGFSGAEIEQAIVSGLYAAHAEQRSAGRPLLMQEIRATRPLSVLMAEQVQALRE